jgi:hypothetical protein
MGQWNVGLNSPCPETIQNEKMMTERVFQITKLKFIKSSKFTNYITYDPISKRATASSDPA